MVQVHSPRQQTAAQSRLPLFFCPAGNFARYRGGLAARSTHRQFFLVITHNSKLSLRSAIFPGMTVAHFATATFPPGQVCAEAAKRLKGHLKDCFAEFTLSEANVLAMT